MPSPNRELILRAAHFMGPLLEDVVFVGGATTELFLTRPVPYDIRITRDVDMIIEVVNRNDYYNFSERIRSRGFQEASGPDNPICRWVHGDLLIDVMPTDEKILGFSNRWYSEAIRFATVFNLDDSSQIRLVTPPHFVATKYEAFLGRGDGDLYSSHDIEDILTLIDGRPEIVTEIQAAPTELRKALTDIFSNLQQHPDYDYAITGHFPGDAIGQARREELVHQIRLLSEMQL